MEFQTLKVALADQVATIELNRPERANAMELRMWTELRDAMRWLDETAGARRKLLMLAGMRSQIRDDCDGRAREKLRRPRPPRAGAPVFSPAGGPRGGRRPGRGGGGGAPGRRRGAPPGAGRGRLAVSGPRGRGGGGGGGAHPGGGGGGGRKKDGGGRRAAAEGPRGGGRGHGGTPSGRRGQGKARGEIPGLTRAPG